LQARIKENTAKQAGEPIEAKGREEQADSTKHTLYKSTWSNSIAVHPTDKKHILQKARGSKRREGRTKEGSEVLT